MDEGDGSESMTSGRIPVKLALKKNGNYGGSKVLQFFLGDLNSDAATYARRVAVLP